MKQYNPCEEFTEKKAKSEFEITIKVKFYSRSVTCHLRSFINQKSVYFSVVQKARSRWIPKRCTHFTKQISCYFVSAFTLQRREFSIVYECHDVIQTYIEAHSQGYL